MNRITELNFQYYCQSEIMNNNDIKILIVEDEVIVAMEIEMGLVSQGYKVVGKAYNSGKAVDAALKQDPDIILMDINIKGGSDGTYCR